MADLQNYSSLTWVTTTFNHAHHPEYGNVAYYMHPAAEGADYAVVRRTYIVRGSDGNSYYNGYCPHTLGTRFGSVFYSSWYKLHSGALYRSTGEVAVNALQPAEGEQVTLRYYVQGKFPLQLWESYYSKYGNGAFSDVYEQPETAQLNSVYRTKKFVATNNISHVVLRFPTTKDRVKFYTISDVFVICGSRRKRLYFNGESVKKVIYWPLLLVNSTRDVFTDITDFAISKGEQYYFEFKVVGDFPIYAFEELYEGLGETHEEVPLIEGDITGGYQTVIDGNTAIMPGQATGSAISPIIANLIGGSSIALAARGLSNVNRFSTIASVNKDFSSDTAAPWKYIGYNSDTNLTYTLNEVTENGGLTISHDYTTGTRIEKSLSNCAEIVYDDYMTYSFPPFPPVFAPDATCTFTIVVARKATPSGSYLCLINKSTKFQWDGDLIYSSSGSLSTSVGSEATFTVELSGFTGVYWSARITCNGIQLFSSLAGYGNITMSAWVDTNILAEYTVKSISVTPTTVVKYYRDNYVVPDVSNDFRKRSLGLWHLWDSIGNKSATNPEYILKGIILTSSRNSSNSLNYGRRLDTSYYNLGNQFFVKRPTIMRITIELASASINSRMLVNINGSGNLLSMYWWPGFFGTNSSINLGDFRRVVVVLDMLPVNGGHADSSMYAKLSIELEDGTPVYLDTAYGLTYDPDIQIYPFADGANNSCSYVVEKITATENTFGLTDAVSLVVTHFGICFSDLPFITGSGTGTRYVGTSQCHVNFPALTMESYNTDNDRADILFPALSSTGEAHYAFGFCEFEQLEMFAGGLNIGDMELPALLATGNIAYCFGLGRIEPSAYALSFNQGVPYSISNELKPRILLFIHKDIVDIADSIFEVV